MILLGHRTVAIVGDTSVQKLASFILRVIDYVQRARHEKNLKYLPPLKEIMESMKTILKAWANLLTKHNMKDLAQHLHVYTEMLKEAEEGDEEKLSLLGLDDIPEIEFTPFKYLPPVHQLRRYFTFLHENALVASFIN